MMFYRMIIWIMFVLSATVPSAGQGNIRWVDNLAALGLDKPKSTAIDIEGNVLFLGFFWGELAELAGVPMVNPDFTQVYLAKFTNEGELIWLQTFDGKDGNPSTAIDILPTFISTDQLGNIFLCGGFRNSVSFGPYQVNWSPQTDPEENTYLVKFDPNGNPLWLKTSRHGDLVIQDITTDLYGNCYVAGFINGSNYVEFDSLVLTNSSNVIPNLTSKYTDFYVVKFSSDGEVLWGLQSLGKKAENIKGIAANAAGELYITGTFNSDLFELGTTHLGIQWISGIGSGIYGKSRPEWSCSLAKEPGLVESF